MILQQLLWEKIEGLIMNEAYKELLIQQTDKTPQVVAIILVTATFVQALCAVLVHPLFFVGVLVSGILAYVLGFRRITTEYEFTYMDKELRIDRIYNRSKRKHMEDLDLNKMEILAKNDSDKIKSYENRQCTNTNYSTNEDNTESLKNYTMYYDGKRRIMFSFDEEMIECIRRLAPMKVENFK